jgi:hypothetical protein
MADEEVIPTERPEDPESGDAAQTEIESMPELLRRAVLKGPECPRKEKGQKLTPELAKELMHEREKAFAKYIEDGKRIFHCDLKGKVEIVGNSFSTEVLVVAQPILIQQAPKPAGDPVPPEPRRRRRRRSKK